VVLVVLVLGLPTGIVGSAGRVGTRLRTKLWRTETS